MRLNSMKSVLPCSLNACVNVNCSRAFKGTATNIPVMTNANGDHISHPRFRISRTGQIIDEKALPGFNLETIRNVRSRSGVRLSLS